MSNSVRRQHVSTRIAPSLPSSQQLRGRAARAMLHKVALDSSTTDAAPPYADNPGYRENFREIGARLAPRNLRYSLPTRCWLHLLVCVVVLTMMLGEVHLAWSHQTWRPWYEQLPGAAQIGMVDPVDSVVPAAIVSPEEITPTYNVAAVAEPAVTTAIMPAWAAPQANNAPVFQDVHRLAEGETLGELVAQYDVSLSALIWANGLQTGDVPAVGQELRIPRISGVPYVLQEGDTLEGVAAGFGVAPEAIWFFEPNMLHPDQPVPVGQEIFIPGGTPPLPEALLARYGGEAGLAALAAQPAGIMRENRTNMRAGPGVEYDRVAQLQAGRRAALLARHAQWLKIDVAGTSGWVRADLLELPEGVIDRLPETNDFPPPPPRWVWPTYGSVSSYFGPRWGSFHYGLDVANRAWTPIVAARSGRVFEAGWCRGYGYCVKIDHGGGVQTVYGHLVDQPVVAVGVTVTAGQLIGHMGSTYDAGGGGYSTGNHLHFEIKLNGRAVDPLKFLP
jgi:murein DD-endopeptidase MepM/ murein hydrolase activator NlpD